MAQRPMGGTRRKQGPDIRRVGEGVIGEDSFEIDRGGSHIWIGKTDADNEEYDSTTWTTKSES